MARGVMSTFKFQWRRNIGGMLNDGTFGSYEKSDKNSNTMVEVTFRDESGEYEKPQKEAKFRKGSVLVNVYYDLPGALELARETTEALREKFHSNFDVGVQVTFEKMDTEDSVEPSEEDKRFMLDEKKMFSP